MNKQQIKNSEYGKPFPYANDLVIGVIDKENRFWFPAYTKVTAGKPVTPAT